ncbi:hypothetical protein GXN76_00235 [Kroppenstedtia pulmonis]|uniref:Uncharacterized protein n=1 Tax=Kroppenstedtia pulmonis TaxID=1380685 RepID=A0A7D3XZG8_9BACL|nr:DUF6179 domain-containing protein [Kroppenstedtia pulmonis]QKG83043.1 hypothetical protein GXN76_00235 [Kroppenstedtia pulmonis]
MESKNLIDVSKWVPPSKIKKVNLKRNPYTLSLLNEGLRTGMLTSQEVYNIQHGLILVLRELIPRYTQGESSSVTSETAEGIMASILYAVDAYALNFEQPDEALMDLKKTNIRDVYEKGVDRVRQCFEETKGLYKKVKQNKLDVPVDAYNMTIDESLPLFMKKYGIIFDAHNTMASIDYPLAIDDMRLQGVFYIRQYLERLNMETQFCRLFAEEDLLKLLSDYGKVCRFDYRIELFNIFGLTLNNALFSVLSGGDANQIKISAPSFNQLKRLFTYLKASEIRSSIHTAMEQLQRDLKTDPPLTTYMNQCRDDLIQRLVNAADHDSLETLIITEKEEKPKSMVLLLNEADRMSDVRLRLVIEKIMGCKTKEEKVQLIRTHFSSLHDYLDLLDSHSLFGDEYEALFETFGDTELAIFAKIVFYEELRSDFLDFETIVFDGTETEIEWRVHFVQFLRSISNHRIRSIENVMSDIDYEEIKFY